MTTLKQTTGSVGTRILAFGAARGDRVVPNDDLVGPIDSSDEWIRQRTGIEHPHAGVGGRAAIDLAVDASREAIAHPESPRSRSTP